LKRVYIDIVGNPIGGLLLAQILFWFLPGKEGIPRARVIKAGRLWIAKRRSDWHFECRISAKQYDRAIATLRAKNLVDLRLAKFNGTPVHHIAINWDVLNQAIQSARTGEGAERSRSDFHVQASQPAHEEKLDLHQRDKSLTKTPSKKPIQKKGALVAPSSFFRIGESDSKAATTLGTTPPSEEAVREIVERTLDAWRTTFSGSNLSDEDRSAAESLCHQYLWIRLSAEIPDALVNRAKVEGIASISELAQKHGPALEATAIARRRLGVGPGVIEHPLSLVVAVLRNWLLAFKNRCGRTYCLSDGDVFAASRFIAANPSVQVNAVCEIMSHALAVAGEPRGEGWDKKFFCRKGTNLAEFLRQYERIAWELGY
jgi:hypothetical protein